MPSLLLQVLGGAGPAIAAVPLTVVWAGGAFYTLASGLGAGKVGPRGAVQRVGYTFFMAIADVCVLSTDPFWLDVLTLNHYADRQLQFVTAAVYNSSICRATHTLVHPQRTVLTGCWGH
jgi:hypothetical protein